VVNIPASLAGLGASLGNAAKSMGSSLGSAAKKAAPAVKSGLSSISKNVGEKLRRKGFGGEPTNPGGSIPSNPIPPSRGSPLSRIPRPNTENMKVYLKQGAKHGIKFSVFILLFIIVGALIIPFIYDTPLLPAHLVTKAVSGFFMFWVNFETWISTFDPIAVWNSFLQKQIDIAQGGYYEGKVDKQRQGSLAVPLGIELKEFKPQRSFFVKGEDDVVLWGRVRARLLENDEDEETRISNLKTFCSIPLSKGNRIFAGEKERSIIDYGDEYFECTFPKENFDDREGGFMAEAHVKFNFETMAYLKTYFMDESRIRLYRMQNKDPLREYGITDAFPIAVYTEGPVKLTIGTNEEFPLRVPDVGEVSTVFGIVIENRHKSEGFISRINEIYLEIPEGLELDSEDCDFGFSDPIYEEDRGSHTIYKKYKILTKEGKLTESKLKNIEEYIRLNCKLKISDRDKLLGNGAFSVEYLRAKTKYDYVLSKKTPIYIREKNSLKDNEEVGSK